MKIIVVFLVVFFIVYLLLFRPKTIKAKGLAGETNLVALVETELQKGLYGHVLRNVYVPRDDGSTSEIDIVLISVKGIFVIESKNFAGYIFGNENSRNWTVSLYAGKNWMGRKTTEKHSFYNPVWQNKTHIKALKNCIKTTAPIYSIVVFSNRGELQDVTFDRTKVRVLTADQFKAYLREVKNECPDTLTEDEVDNIAEKIIQFAGADSSVKRSHIENIKKKTASPTICPWCGGELILRTAKKGQHVGRQFYGCSNYPTCKYTRSISRNESKDRI